MAMLKKKSAKKPAETKPATSPVPAPEVKKETAVMTEEALVKVLSVILGHGVSQTEDVIFKAILKAGEKLKIDTKKILPGCGAEAIRDVFHQMAEKSDVL